MPTLTIPNTLVSGAVVDPAALNANFTAVADAVNGNIGVDNLDAPYALFCHSIRLPGPVTSATTDGTNVFRFKAPVGITLVPVEVQAAYELESATSAAATFQATANGSNLLSAALALSAPDTVVTSNSFSVSSITSAQEVVGTFSVSSDTITHITVTMFFKAYLQG